MRTLKRTLLASSVALGLIASGTASAQFSNMVFIGDSLSDAGYYGGARFTVNPGLVWAQDLGAAYGFTIKPSNQGGTDYAQGGARVTLPSASTPSGFAQRPASVQINELLAKTPTLDPNALYAVWIGGNEILQGLQEYAGGLITATQLQANIATSAVQAAQQVERLHAAGAKYIVISNLGNGQLTPYGVANPAVPLASLSSLYDSTLGTALGQLPFDVINVNTGGLLKEVVASPSTYGFTNATKGACTTSSAISCTPATLVTPNAAQTYVWADDVHPSPAMHAIVAQYVASVLQAPQQMGALAEAPLAVEQANWRTLDGRMVSGINAPRSPGKLEAWAAYDYGAPDVKSNYFNGDGSVNTIAVGGDIKMSDRLLVGAMFNYSTNDSDYGGTGYKLDEPMGTLYAGYGEGPWYVGATLGAGGLDYSTTRSIALGEATREETGNTSGWQYVGRLMGGYWFKYGDWVHGPNVKLTYQEIRVRQFQESGANSTTMTFGQQERKSFVTSLGWQLSGNLGGIRPFARATWEYEGQSDERTVTASIYGMSGSFGMPAYKPDSNWGLFNLGAATEFGKITGFITGSATAGKGDGDYYAVTVGIRAPL